jgi:aarF domain-containing kinase
MAGLALAVDPDFKVFAASYPFVLQRLLTDNSPPLRKVLISVSIYVMKFK